MRDFMVSLEDFMVSFAAISGTYMLIGSIAILILFKMNRPLLLRICRAAIKNDHYCSCPIVCNRCTLL